MRLRERILIRFTSLIVLQQNMSSDLATTDCNPICLELCTVNKLHSCNGSKNKKRGFIDRHCLRKEFAAFKLKLTV